MPLGKHRFTQRQHDQAMRIKSSLKKRGEDEDEAERIAWATVNKNKGKGFAALRRAGKGKKH